MYFLIAIPKVDFVINNPNSLMYESVFLGKSEEPLILEKQAIDLMVSGNYIRVVIINGTDGTEWKLNFSWEKRVLCDSKELALKLIANEIWYRLYNGYSNNFEDVEEFATQWKIPLNLELQKQILSLLEFDYPGWNSSSAMC